MGEGSWERWDWVELGLLCPGDQIGVLAVLLVYIGSEQAGPAVGRPWYVSAMGHVLMALPLVAGSVMLGKAWLC